MASGTQSGYLVLADISGFTRYLAATELEHAHEILSDLLEVIASSLIPPLSLAKLEGDAVFAYAPAARVPRGETLLEAIDATYVTFRDRVEAMRRQTTCECNACRAIPTLDLKFITHFGEYIIQHMAMSDEMLGADVNIVHRLAKNHVADATGWHAYALFSEAALAKVGLELESLHLGEETYDFGDIRTYSYDLRQRYAMLADSRRVLIEPAEADYVLTRDIRAPVPLVWTWLTEPQRFIRWAGVADMRASHRPGGRTGVGARNHCVHGKAAVEQTILDWKPFRYYTYEQKGMPAFTSSLILTPTDTGTRLHMTIELKSRAPGFLTGPMCRAMFTGIAGMQKKADTLVRLAEEEARQTSDSALQAAAASAG